MKKNLFIKQTQSTNQLLWEMKRSQSLPEGFVVRTDFQTAGKGQIGNSWESEFGKNLLFSLLLNPLHVPVDEQFRISQLVSVAVKKTLDEYCDGITVKWPNDIYWNDKKLAGILIENSLQGNKIKSTLIGIGLNVNQKIFVSDAPNPVSLVQITGKTLSRKKILDSIVSNILDLYRNNDVEKITNQYHAALYRSAGFHTYKSDTETFQAKIIRVHPDGQLELEKESGERKSFYFKEIQFV